jgi:hypothetical protein
MDYLHYYFNSLGLCYPQFTWRWKARKREIGEIYFLQPNFPSKARKIQMPHDLRFRAEPSQPSLSVSWPSELMAVHSCLRNCRTKNHKSAIYYLSL